MSIVAVLQVAILNWTAFTRLSQNWYGTITSFESYCASSHRELKRCLGMFAYYTRWIKNYSGEVKPLTVSSVSFPLLRELRSELPIPCL